MAPDLGDALLVVGQKSNSLPVRQDATFFSFSADAATGTYVGDSDAKPTNSSKSSEGHSGPEIRRPPSDAEPHTVQPSAAAEAAAE